MLSRLARQRVSWLVSMRKRPLDLLKLKKVSTNQKKRSQSQVKSGERPQGFLLAYVLVSQLPRRLGRCSIPLVCNVHLLTNLDSECNTLPMRALLLVLLVVVVVVVVVCVLLPRTGRPRPNFQTALHSGVIEKQRPLRALLGWIRAAHSVQSASKKNPMRQAGLVGP